MSDHNPYAAPSAKLDSPPPKLPPKGAFVKGLLAALAVDLGGSLIVGMLLTFVYSALASMDGQSQEEIMEALRHIPHDSWLYIVGTLCGGFLSFVGGYVGVRIARQQEIALGLVQAVCSVAFGLVLGSGDLSFGMQIAFSGLTVLLIMLGVRFAVQRNRRGV